MRRSMLAVVLALATVASPTALADHTEEDQLRCDGGFCQDHEDHVLDCTAGTCTGGGGFPTIVAPSYAEDNPRLSSDDRVLGTEIGGEARAYPIEVLRWFETVEDEIGGEPVLVTYCPLCAAGVVFERRIDNETLTLYNSGEIWHNDLVLYEQETKSRFSQVLGEGIKGPMHGETLPLLPSTITTWRTWQEGHPDTLVLEHPVDEDGTPLADYDADPYASYRHTTDTPQPRPIDNRTDLHPKTNVAGVEIAGEAFAFPAPVVRDLGPVEVDVGGTEVVAAWLDGGVHVYATEGRDFQAGPTNRTLVDADGGRWWVANGTGPGGKHLERVTGQTLFWFAWLDANPGTDVLTREGETVQADPTGRTSVSPLGVPGPSAALVVALLAGLAASRRLRAP